MTVWTTVTAHRASVVQMVSHPGLIRTARRTDPLVMTATTKKRRWALLETFIIGRQDNPMMKRIRLIQTPAFGIYLHFVYREDADRDIHDHPWKFFRMVLKGGYTEVYTDAAHIGELRTQAQTPFRPSVVPMVAAHRITSVLPGTVTIVAVGPKKRTWGFWVSRHDWTRGGWSRHFVDWQTYAQNGLEA